MPVLWPASLQQTVNTSGFVEGFADTLVRSTNDTGPAKVRRRFTKGVKPIKCSIWVTEEEYEILENFYNTDVAGGALQFQMNHPITGVSTLFRFVSPPTINPVGSGGIEFNAEFSLEIMP